MTNNWMEDSRELLLKQAKEIVWIQERMEEPSYFDEFRGALAPLGDGTVDPSDLDRVVDSMLAMLGEQQYLASLRRGAKINVKLHDTYSRLQDAADDDVQAFACMQLQAFLHGYGMLERLSKLPWAT